MRPLVKVAVTGAAGQIGYALIFRIASGQMFGLDTDIELHLLELEHALPALQGVAMELDDCAFPLLKKVVCTASLKEAMDGVHWALLVGAVPRKDGMERADLLKINGGIFTTQGKAINDYADRGVRVFVVGNPCNTNCLIAMHHAPDVPRDRFFAMTSLDNNRARMQLALKANVAVEQVKKVTIWGNHSATQFPDFFYATIAGKPLLDVIQDHHWLENDFIPLVQKRGALVIKARGSSSAGSAANAVIDGVRSLVTETKSDDWFSVGQYACGEYGVQDLIFSYPTRVVNGKLGIVSGLVFNEFAMQSFQTSLTELQGEYDAVKSLGLITA